MIQKQIIWNFECYKGTYTEFLSLKDCHSVSNHTHISITAVHQSHIQSVLNLFTFFSYSKFCPSQKSVVLFLFTICLTLHSMTQIFGYTLQEVAETIKYQTLKSNHTCQIQNIKHWTSYVKSYLSDTKSGMHFFINALATDSSEDVRPCADFWLIPSIASRSFSSKASSCVCSSTSSPPEIIQKSQNFTT